MQRIQNINNNPKSTKTVPAFKAYMTRIDIAELASYKSEFRKLTKETNGTLCIEEKDKFLKLRIDGINKFADFSTIIQTLAKFVNQKVLQIPFKTKQRLDAIFMAAGKLKEETIPESISASYTFVAR